MFIFLRNVSRLPVRFISKEIGYSRFLSIHPSILSETQWLISFASLNLISNVSSFSLIQEVLDIVRFLLAEIEKGGSSNEIIEEKKSKLEQVRQDLGIIWKYIKLYLSSELTLTCS